MKKYGPFILIVAIFLGIYLFFSKPEVPDNYDQIDYLKNKVDSLENLQAIFSNEKDSLHKIEDSLIALINQSEQNIIYITQKYEKMFSDLNNFDIDEHIEFFSNQVSY